MTPPERETCEAEVWVPPGYWDYHRCSRPAKTERDGHKVCGIHARMKNEPYWYKA